MEKNKHFIKLTIIIAAAITVILLSQIAHGLLSNRKSLLQTQSSGLDYPIYIAGTSKEILAIKATFAHMEINLTYTERLDPEIAEKSQAILLDDTWIQKGDADIRATVDALALKGKLIIVVGDLSKYAFDDLAGKLYLDPREDMIRSYDKQIVGRDPTITFAVHALKVYPEEQTGSVCRDGVISLSGRIADYSAESLADYIVEIIQEYAK